MSTKLPEFKNFSECRKFCLDIAKAQPHCRPGQALVNRYDVPRVLKDRVYEEPDEEKVIQRVWNFQLQSKV